MEKLGKNFAHSEQRHAFLLDDETEKKEPMEQRNV